MLLITSADTYGFVPLFKICLDIPNHWAAVIDAFDKWIGTVGTYPLAVYVDPGSAFTALITVDHLQGRQIMLVYAPAGSHRSVGHIEALNRVFQNVLNRIMASLAAPITVKIMMFAVASRCGCKESRLPSE